MHKFCHTCFVIENCQMIYYNFFENDYVACYLRETSFHNINIDICYDLQHNKHMKDYLIS